uniref:ZP domain-containing protein n=1 Tax=Panagrolaimus sp. PS1159 TaxID=55785 RepID=A0AC35FTY0_9BILA
MAIQALASIVLIVFSTSTTISGATPFNPTLEWTCELSSIFVAIRTSSPFNGIAHSKDESLNCTTIGNGTTVTKLIIPLGADNNQCGVKFNKDTGLYWVDIEVHEHKLLILEQDRLFNVTCDKNAISLKIGNDDGDHLIGNDDANSTDAFLSSSTNSILLPTIEFNLELVPNDDSKTFEILSDHDVEYGQSYTMNISFKSEYDKNEYEADDTAVELVDSHGCSINKKLMTDFVYKNGYATAKIPSMFRFPNSKTMKFECKLSICQEIQVCRPNCDRKMDDPIIAEVEDAEMIAHLLGMDDESVQSAVTDPMQSVDEKPTKSTSTIVHVLDRREIPLRNDVTTKPGNDITSTECFASDEILSLYAILFGLALVLALSVVFNIWCCLCCRKKKAEKEKRRKSYLFQNECWITGNPTVEITKDVNQEAALAAYLAERRPSVGSYATVKQRFSARPMSQAVPPMQYMEMQEPSTTFRPINQAPSPPQPPRLSVYDHPSQNLSTFRQSVSADSSSGTSTWSPGRNSQVDTSREASSIL